ncbi:hypothetical protein ACQUQU_14145 [Thalassolituus sp. LLYu03]|uniref:hypothetical protein n=1 Tax=Thalassolituus sp. LLYu03 TaxID=3421656 RepID=UPI003D2A06DB
MKLRTLFLLPLMVLASAVQALNPYGFETFVHHGHVYARSVVTTDDGKPIWAEYNEHGGHSKINSVTGVEGFVLAASQVGGFITMLDLFRAQYDGDIELMPVSQFTGQTFQTSDGRDISNWPALPADAISVAIPGKARRHSDNGAYIEYYSFPVDMLALPSTVSPDDKSMLFNEDGKLIYTSPERIGYLTAFYLKDGKTVPDDAAEYENTSSLISLAREGYKILDPVPGVFIEAITGYRNGIAYSRPDGSYRLQAWLSPCPGFQYQASTTAYATFYYANFNPRGSPRIPYYLMHTSYDNCIGYGAFPPGNDLGALSAQLTVIGIISSAPDNITTLNYAVGVNVLSGRVLFAGASIGDATEYSAETAAQNFYMAADDYDGDGEKDKTVRGTISAEGQFEANAEGNVYGVYFSANERIDGQPNITRIMDLAPDLQHKGLLKTVSLDDVKQTDILVFRESTGELITQRSGLNEHEYSDASRTVLDGDNNFAYTLAIRSPEDMHSFKRLGHDNFVTWQASNKMSPALQSYKADFLRTGEQVRVVAINRPTGYIGTATTVLTSATDGGDLTVRVPPVVLTPPNLKVWATRRHQGQGLLKNSDEERTTISNEGAATTDDSLVEIHTEWLDQDGYPLPAGLAGYGYTGRLTKQIDSADSGDPYDNSVAEFDINPGRQLQVLNFDNNPYHHYLQVNGYPSGEQNDFSAGDHTGALRHRPAQYVPVRVPLYNEQGSIEDKLAIAAQEQSTRNLTPRFNWVYRPELSFSVVDLEVESIIQKNEDSATDSGNLLDDDIPAINNSYDLVEVIFNLIGSEYERITALDGEQQYIFALGDQEIEVRIDKGEGNEQQIQFTNLDYLSQLDVEDYLTLSLYLNQDAQNVLWEWGFEDLIVTSRDVDNDLETDDVYYVSADDPVVPIIALLNGYSDRDPELKAPMKLRWKTNNGSLSVSQEVNETNGIFKTDLTMPTQAGSRAQLTAELVGSDNINYFKPVEVIPGAPANIVVRQSAGAASIGVLESASQEYEITITDAHGNIVSDGTSVAYALDGYAKTVNQETATTAGKAHVTVTGSERFDDAVKLTISSGAATKVVDLASLQLVVSIDMPDEMKVGTSQQATITVENPAGSAEGLEVAVSAPHLGVAEQTIVLDADGKATVTLMAPPVPVDTYVHARVGYAGSDRKQIRVVAPDASIAAANYRPLLGEKTQAGAYSYERFDGVQLDLGYEVEKSVTLKANAGEVIHVVLGDAYFPNNMPEFALALDASSLLAFSSDAPKDDTGIYSVTAGGVTLDAASMYGMGSSSRFDGSASITSPAAVLAAVQRPNWAMAIKPEQAGTLVNLGGGQSLGIAGGEIFYRITTSDGTYQVRTPVQLDKWQKVAARVTDTQLELYVDDFSSPATATYSGTILPGNGELTIGSNFTGLMQELRFYNGQSQPLLAINNQGSDISIQADSTGSATVGVNSLGTLNAAGQTLGLTYVHLVHNGQRTHIPVISEEGFKQIGASAANIALIGPPLVLSDVTDYSDYDPWGASSLPFSSLMPQAHASSWLMEGLDLFIPVSSVLNVVEQIGKIGTEEFDPVVLVVAVLDVAISFSGPLAPALKAAFKPLAKLLTNPATKKLVGIMGPFLGKVAERVVDSKSIDPLLSLLPFLMIVGEIAADEEAREAIPIIFDAISSSEDLQVWFDYFNLPEDGWEGDVQPSLELELASLDSSALPLGVVVPQAYAANGRKRLSGKQASEKIRRTLAALKKGEITSKEAAAHITRAMDDIIYAAKNIPDARAIATATQTLIAGGALLATKGGVRRVRDLLKGNNGPEKMRTPILLQLAAIAYMESKIGCAEAGCIGSDTQLARGFRSLYLKSFATIATGEYKTQNTVNGSQYHLVMAALLHAWGEAGKSPYGKLVSIEQQANIYLQSRSPNADYVTPRVIRPDESGDFERMVDLVTQQGADKPQFIEVKSYLGVQDGKERTESQIKASFSIWEYKPTNSKQKPHKQYLLDRIMATDNQLIKDPIARNEQQQASEIHWFFQKFKLKTRSGLTDKQMDVIRSQLAQNASGENKKISASLGYKKYALAASKTQAGKDIKRFGLTTIIKDSSSEVVSEIFNLDALSDDQKAKEIERIQKAVFALIDET